MTDKDKELRRLAQAALVAPDGLSAEWMDRLGQFQESVSPAAIIELLDRLEAARTAWKEADKACRDLTEKVIPNLRESLEAVEKDRDYIAQQLVQSEIGKRAISEAHNAVTRRLNVLANENIALSAKIEAMESQKPTGFVDGDGRAILQRELYPWADLYALPGAQPAAVPEGWQLVPVRPDERMLSAARFATESEGIVVSAWLRRRIYDSMLAAAPKPENKE